MGRELRGRRIRHAHLPQGQRHVHHHRPMGGRQMQRPCADLQQEREPCDPGVRLHARRRHRCGSHLAASLPLRRSHSQERVCVEGRDLPRHGLRRGLSLLSRRDATV